MRGRLGPCRVHGAVKRYRYNFVVEDPPPKAPNARKPAGIPERQKPSPLEQALAKIGRAWVKFTCKLTNATPGVLMRRYPGYEFTTRLLPSGKCWLYCRRQA